MKPYYFLAFLLFSGLSLRSQTLNVDFKSVDSDNRIDTFEFCAPHLYHFSPITTILDNMGKPVASDSVIQWVWNWGEYGGKNDTLTQMDSFKRHIYSYNYDFTVSLTCITAKGLTKTMKKNNYIHQYGPGKFSFSFVSDTIGPSPLHVKIKVHHSDSNYKNGNSRIDLGNGSYINYATVGDTTIIASYNVAGSYYVSYYEVGDVYNFTTGTTIKCSASWPDTSIWRPMIVIVTTTAGIENNTSEKENLSLYYSENNLNVQWDSKEKTYVLNIYDITGKELLKQKLISSEKESINISGFSKGIYIVHLNDGQNSIARKIAVW